MGKQFKLLLLGCGDIATRLANQLDDTSYDITGLRRKPGQPGQFPVLAGDASNLHDIGALMQVGFDAVVVTMTPLQRSEAGYREGYYQPVNTLLQGIAESGAQPLVLFVSSTSVYGQNQGEWVDEQSLTEPAGFAGRVLLETEQLLRESEAAHCILRFSGIYGPGRSSQLKAVFDNRPLTKPCGWTNRIHSDDCAGVIAHLLERYRKGALLEPVYLASDNQPVMQWQLRKYLTEQLGVAPSSLPESNLYDHSAVSGKCCSNQLLVDSGYQWRFADYQRGYADVIQQLNGER